MALAKDDLRALQFQEYKLFLRPAVGEFKAAYVAPKRRLASKSFYVKSGNDTRKSAIGLTIGPVFRFPFVQMRQSVASKPRNVEWKMQRSSRLCQPV